MRSGSRLPEVSLRLRLLALLVGLAAIGLAGVGLISYQELHSYLYDRVDQQLQAAFDPVAQALLQKSGPVPKRFAPPDALQGRRGFGAQPPAAAGGPGPSPVTQLPPGTYGELRARDGKPEAKVLFGYGETDLPRPALPAHVQASAGRGPPQPFTVGASGGSSTEFRVIAVAGPRGTSMFVAVPLSETQATLNRLAVIEAVVSAAVLIALALLAWWLLGVGLRPLRRMGEVADDIAAGDLSRRVKPANPRTEVGRLGLALNAMLAQIERAFAEREAGEARLRRFLADASHELRTPLAAIRGYAELHRMGAQSEPPQVDRAMGRIEAEATRMGGLVDDLLTLARVDEVREPAREEVALGELLAEAVEGARAAARERRISIRANEALLVQGDADQLRRVFDNLLRNAVLHTPAEVAIEVSLSRQGEEAVARVRDHGPGLGAGDPQAVFERFWRSSASRGRDDGGAGLGLAIVAAIVRAHHGEVEAANAPGGGAEFTVRLPVSPAP
jgi:two-component system, OmpR family, sensor kinase